MSNVETVLQEAVSALTQYYTKKRENKLDGASSMPIVRLKFTPMKCVPENHFETHFLPMPNVLYDKVNLCLITKTPCDKWQNIGEALKDLPISFVKVIDLSILKSTYKDLTNRDLLISSFDLFIADRAIISSIPSILGGKLLKAGKIPFGMKFVNIEKIKQEIKKILYTSKVILNRSISFKVRIGLINQPIDDLVENGLVTIKSMKEILAAHDTEIFQVAIQYSGESPLIIMQKPKIVLPEEQNLVEVSIEENKIITAE